jgi:carbon-monoxide dehydrogenase large subunit
VPSALGLPLRRLEDERLITGRGRYAGDIKLDGLLHLAVLRSNQPHARVNSVDTTVAAAMPGVRAVYTAADLPESGRRMTDWVPRHMAELGRPVLATDEARHVGEGLVAVVAGDPYAAQDAIDQVLLELEPLPGAGSLGEALAEGGARAHQGLDSNLAASNTIGYGEIEAAFEASDTVTVRERFTAARICGAAMEPRVVTAKPGGDRPGDVLTIWTSTQAIFQVRDQVAQMLGLEKEHVVVLAEDVGGGFGPKGGAYPEEILVAHAALRLQRPVRWTATRSEDTATTVQAHGPILELELAAAPDGKLRGLRGVLWHDLGAYPGAGAGQPDIIVPHLISAYVLPALQVETHLVLTNATPTGFVRGGGRPLGNFGMERMMDRLAARLGLDPAVLRERNLIQPEQMPYATGLGRTTYDGGDYPKLLATALETLGYEELRQNPPKREGWVLGVGIACCVESSGFGRGEPARVRLEKDGSAHLFVGSTPQGQGHVTMAAQMLAERLGWPMDKIRVTAGDTRAVDYAFLTAGSRSAMHVGNATSLAAQVARRKLLEQAAEVLEADPADLVLEDGRISVKGAPTRAIPVSQAIPESGLEVSETWAAETPTAFSSGCHATAIWLDPETGAVDLFRYVIAYDTGRAINPLLLEGQLLGGLAHGLGYALFEESLYERDGSFRSASFLDYSIPSAPEVSIQPRLQKVESETSANPEKVKGAGESGTIPVPAAIANAVEDALRTLRPEAAVTAIPITPQRVLQLLHR